MASLRAGAPAAVEQKLTVFALDVSGSTSGATEYFRVAGQLLEEAVSQPGTRVRVLLWNHMVAETTLDGARARVSASCGDGGTDLGPLAKKLRDDGAGGALILVTDGQVDHASVGRADDVLRTARPASFQRVEVHLISTGSALNLSVAAPFVRSSQFGIHVYDRDGERTSATRGDSRTTVDLSHIATPDQFDQEYDGIYATLLAQNLGRTNRSAHDAVLAMRARVLKAANRTHDADGWGVPAIGAALDARNYESAGVQLRALVRRYYADGDTSASLAERCERLLMLCTSEGCYDTSLLQRTSLLARTDAAPAEPGAAPPPEQEAFLECPILCDQDVPVILLAQQEQPLLEGLDKADLDKIVANPLWVALNAPLLAKLATSMDSVVGFEFYSRARRPLLSPTTRRPTVGAVILGDNDACVRGTSFSLAQLCTGGKLPGNAQLWYLLVWHVARATERLHAPGFLAALDGHLKWRAAQGGLVRLALSGLPDQVLVAVPLRVALFYCVMSAEWYDDVPARDRMRELWPLAGVLFDVLDRLEYGRADKEHRVVVLRAFSYLMAHKPELDAIADSVRALDQNHLWLPGCGRYAFLDGPAAPESAAAAAKRLPGPLRAALAASQLRRLVHLARGNLNSKPGVVVVDVGRVVASEPTLPVASHYSDQENKMTDNPITICPATLRPLYSVGGGTWEEAAVAKYGPLKQQISLYGLYGKFVISQRTRPDQSDAAYERFVLYCASSQRNRFEYTTLPSSFPVLWHWLVRNFAEAYAKLSDVGIDAVVARLKTSFSIEERKRLESEWVAG